MRICCISDTHNLWERIEIPECDILISAGDYSSTGKAHSVKDFHNWLNKQHATHIISLQGNHELWVENNFYLAKQIALEECPRVHFIEEGLIEIGDLKIWCSAITPRFFNWAYNRDRGTEIKSHWDRIPNDIDVLVTHGPPHGIGDLVTMRNSTNRGEMVGCKDLLTRVQELDKLKLHVFGHIHSGYGKYNLHGKVFVNAAIVDDNYTQKNAPVVIDLEKI